MFKKVNRTSRENNGDISLVSVNSEFLSGIILCQIYSTWMPNRREPSWIPTRPGIYRSNLWSALHWDYYSKRYPLELPHFTFPFSIVLLIWTWKLFLKAPKTLSPIDYRMNNWVTSNKWKTLCSLVFFCCSTRWEISSVYCWFRDWPS